MPSLVYVKNPNGRTYVYSNVSVYDKEAKKVRHIRKSIGHLDPVTGEVVPNRRKGDIARERAKSPEPVGRCVVENTGMQLLLDKAVSDIGLERPLSAVFPDDWKRILTCAYYLVSEGGALCHVSQWQQMYASPFRPPLTSQRVSELLTRITPTLQQDFFGKWADVNRQKDVYAMDITSVSSYSEQIDFVRWGYNRDGEKLPQINLIMLTGVRSHMPLYYRVIPGSIKDVNTLEDNIANISLLETPAYQFVMDKGFYSEPNLDVMYASHKKFLVGVPFTTDLACKAVERHRDSIRSHHNYCMVYGDELYAATESSKWKGHRFYIHIYYDSFKAAMDERNFDHTLHCCYEELLSGKHVKEHSSYYDRFFLVHETPIRGIRVDYNEEAINRHKRNHIGWFVLVSNHIKDHTKALEIYRDKDSVEKCFDDLKNDLDMKRLRIHSAATMEGRLFIQFIALLITTRLKQVMNEAGWFKKHDLKKLLCEMKTVQHVTILGTRKFYTTELTAFQMDIYDLFGLSI